MGEDITDGILVRQSVWTGCLCANGAQITSKRRFNTHSLLFAEIGIALVILEEVNELCLMAWVSCIFCKVRKVEDLEKEIQGV